MAGHVRKRRVCATKGCGTTWRNGAKACHKCQGKRAKTSWQARVPDPIKGGTAKIEKVFHDRAQAQAFVHDTASEQRKGAKHDTQKQRQTFAEVAAIAKLQDVGRRRAWDKLKRRTRVSYEENLANHVLPAFGTTPIAQVTTQRIEAFLNDKAKTHHPNTVERIKQPIFHVMQWAAKHGYVVYDPTVNVTFHPPKHITRANGNGKPDREDEQRFLTPTEIDLLAWYMPNDTYKLAVYLAGWTGLRAGELWALKRSDIVFADGHGEIRVSRALVESDSKHLAEAERGYREEELKTRYSRRRIPLPREIKVMLARHLMQRPPTQDTYVFATSNNTPIRHNNWIKRFNKLRDQWLREMPDRQRAAELAGFTWHELRHTAGSLWLDAGVDGFRVVKRMGWSNDTMLHKTYGHILRERDRADSELLDAQVVVSTRAEPS